ncbi:putative reverse transcriptase domain-containing protein [Tanacetum coccineum]
MPTWWIRFSGTHQSHDYVPGPFTATEDECPARRLLLHLLYINRTADSPDYVPESDPKEDPKEDDDEDLWWSCMIYHTDGGDWRAMMRMRHAIDDEDDDLLILRGLEEEERLRGTIMWDFLDVRMFVMGITGTLWELMLVDMPRAPATDDIESGVDARDADRNTNDDDSHNSRTGVRRTEELPVNCALMWWNSYVRTVGHDVVYVMTWTDLKKKMTGKYCPRGEIKKLEAELMFPKESDKIERYVSGLPDMIYGSVLASSPKIMQEAIKIATELINKKIQTFVERQKPTCYECGAQVHFKRDCPKLKNNNRGNQGRNGNASGKVYSVGRVGTNPDSNVVTGTFLLNNRYASVLFDTGADRSFVSIAFSS